MADAEIKKAVIQRSSLPPLDSTQEKYVVRYRIVSEDRNRSSHWSPQYLISPNNLQVDTDVGITVTSNGSIVTAVWDTISDTELNSYDVFIAWGTQIGSVGLTEYLGTVTGNYLNIPVPDASKVSVQIFIQTNSLPRKRIDAITIAKSDVKNV
tara:strand:+ start:10888 stop:11346 length:459 start_codon:yes stop_codon:yes gene_type:complete